MPELEIQRREGGTAWWMWLIGALLLGLLIWGAVELLTPERRGADIVPAQQVAGERQITPGTEGAELLPVAAILEQPTQYMGQSVSGTATVAEVPTDRGFWLEQDGKRVFAIIDEPSPETKDVNAGQQVRINGTVYSADRASELPVTQQLDAETRRILDEQPAFVYVTARDLEILSR